VLNMCGLFEDDYRWIDPLSGQCDARPTVTFPAAEHHRHLAGTKLYCLVSNGDRGTWV